jgi:hypothetical protein
MGPRPPVQRLADDDDGRSSARVQVCDPGAPNNMTPNRRSRTRAWTIVRWAALVLIAAATVGCGAARSHLMRRTAGDSTVRSSPAVAAGSPGDFRGPASRGDAGEAEASLVRLSGYLVDNLADRTYSNDPEFFSHGWQSADPSCWMCNTGPGATAAVLSTLTTGSRARRYRGLTEETFTDAIQRQLSNGAFPNPTDPQAGDEIPTVFFGVELGQAYLQMAPALTPRTRNRWRTALARAARYLITTGATTYYANGNIQLQITELLYDAWRATGSATLRTAYDHSWSFTLDPGPGWPGFGLVITHDPTNANGSNGRGYLAESGGGQPGYDADYTQLQADEVARLYVYSRDKRALRLLNLLTNQLLPNVTHAGLLDTSRGTRHSASDRYIPFTSAAPAVLAWLGGRADLRSTADKALMQLQLSECAGLTYSYSPLYRAMGNELSVVLVAASRDVGAAGIKVGRIVCPNIPLTLRRRLVN